MVLKLIMLKSMLEGLPVAFKSIIAKAEKLKQLQYILKTAISQKSINNDKKYFTIYFGVHLFELYSCTKKR
ncbi:hypothetical protein BW716_34220 [[Flexibacter] sp. ATCC 35208]|nr:hypothetical protein BW716_34220 [[Flexibacter] sp. ATCC 35208]